MNHPDAFPGDIFAVKSMGLDKWRRKFWCPIPDHTFSELSDRLLALFDSAYADLPEGRPRDLLFADFGFYMRILQYLHSNATREICRSVGAEFIEGPLAMQQLHPDFSALATYFEPGRVMKNVFSFQLRRLAKNIKFRQGPLLAWALALTGRSSTWSLGSWSRLKKDYAKNADRPCNHVYIQNILRGRGLRPAEIPAYLDEKLTDLANEAAGLFHEYFGCKLDVTEPVACWQARLRSLGGIYDACVAGPAPDTLLLSEVARAEHKAVSLSLRSAGTRIIGFHHGNDMAVAWEPLSAYVEYAHCNEFVCPTEAAARFHGREYRQTGISALCPVEFSSAETARYTEVRTGAAHVPTPPKIRSVMIMGYPMNALRKWDRTADWFLYQLDLEIRLSEYLRGLGFKVIYKMHPERKTEAQGMLDPFCDEILAEPFEGVWQRADAFLFPCTTTTTFGFTLCLDRPVIVLDVEGRKWNPEAYELLARRCEMVPAWFGEGDRVEFDEAVLEKAVSSPVLPPDMRFVDRFMTPKKDYQEGAR